MFTDTQALFARSLHPDADPATLVRTQAKVRNHGGLKAEQRLMIYRRNVTAALVMALKDIYPVCLEIIGEAMFSHLAEDYVWHADSSSPDLNYFGRDFDDYLDERISTDAVLEALPYLGDLARLECDYHAAWYADDDPAFDFSAFSQAAESGVAIHLCTSHSLTLLTSDYPVLRLWKLHRYHRPPATLEGLDRPDHYCIYRRGYTPAVIRIAESEYCFLDACQRHRSLNIIAMDHHAAPALERLPLFIRHGWICGTDSRP